MNLPTAFCKLQLCNAEGLTPAELREAKRQAMARLQEVYIPARFSLDEPTVIVLGVPVTHKRLRQALGDLWCRWQAVDGGDGAGASRPRSVLLREGSGNGSRVRNPYYYRKGRACPCGTPVWDGSVTGVCHACWGRARAYVPSEEMLDEVVTMTLKEIVAKYRVGEKVAGRVRQQARVRAGLSRLAGNKGPRPWQQERAARKA